MEAGDDQLVRAESGYTFWPIAQITGLTLEDEAELKYLRLSDWLEK